MRGNDGFAAYLLLRNERGDSRAVGKRLVTRQHDDGLEPGLGNEQKSKTTADRGAKSARPFRILDDAPWRPSQFVFDQRSKIADDERNRRASSFRGNPKSAADKCFPLKLQQLLRPTETRRSTGRENYGADVAHSPSAVTRAGFGTTFQPWIGVLRSRNDPALVPAKTA